MTIESNALLGAEKAELPAAHLPEPALNKRAKAPRSRWRSLALRAIGPVTLLVIWQILGGTGIIAPGIISTPGAVLGEFFRVSEGGELAKHIAISLQRAGLGLLIGASLGTLFGIVSGVWKIGEIGLDSTFRMFQAVPWTALLPLFILWFGIGEFPKVFFIATVTFFPMYINTFAGIRQVDVKLVEAGRLLGLNNVGIIREIVLPGAVPTILVGLRFSLIYAVGSLVIAEQIGSSSGIGYLLQQAQQYLQTPLVMLAIVLYALMGLIADVIVRLLEAVLLPWRKNFTGA